MTTCRLSNLNPLRGLTLEGLVAMLEHGEQGFYADLQWLFRMVLRRNATARAVRRKLTGAIGRLDWDIKVRSDAAGFDKVKADAQARTLRDVYERIGNLRSALAHLAMADLLGFAHCEKIYAGSLAARLLSTDPKRARALRAMPPWTIVELREVPQWNLCRAGLFAPWEYNSVAAFTNRGIPIDPRFWVVREIDDPAAEIFAFAHLKMAVTDADWDQFCDTYAVPPIFLEGPPNIGKSDEQEFSGSRSGSSATGVAICRTAAAFTRFPRARATKAHSPRGCASTGKRSCSRELAAF